MTRLLTILIFLLALPVMAQTSLYVTNFGAKGDCQQVWVSTTSNSVAVVFTNSLSASDIGKTVELFGVGTANNGTTVWGTNATMNQDLLAVITNVVGNTAYLSNDIPVVTSNGVYCVYGTDNAAPFMACINAASGTNAIINIPAGNFLMLPACNYTNYDCDSWAAWQYNTAALVIYGGGLQFSGAGRGQTIITSQGAFKHQGNFNSVFRYNRGVAVYLRCNLTNSYPIGFQNLTFDGGVRQGYIDYWLRSNQTDDTVDGLGWDGTCRAFAVTDPNACTAPFPDISFNSVEFRHMKGEMLFYGGSANGNVTITNCNAWDGQATFYNLNFAHVITGCTFSNLLQVSEYYGEYSTNRGSLFANNFCTNIYWNVIFLTGGTGTNQPYVMSNNVFYANTISGNVVGTGPYCNVTIISNQFNCEAVGNSCITLGEAGEQGTGGNTNIVIQGNNFYGNPYVILYVHGGDGPTSDARSEKIKMWGNTVSRSTDVPILFYSSGWYKDVTISSNNFLGCPLGITENTSDGYPFQYPLFETNNTTTNPVVAYFEGTNTYSYGSIPWKDTVNTASNVAFVLSTTDSNYIPSGAQFVLNNRTNSGYGTYTVFLNSAMTSSVVVTNGQMAVFDWSPQIYSWSTTAPSQPPEPSFNSVPWPHGPVRQQ